MDQNVNLISSMHQLHIIPYYYLTYFGMIFVNLRLIPPHKEKKKRGEGNIGKQEQYVTDDHPSVAHFSHLVPPPPNTLTRTPSPFPTTSVFSIVTPYPPPTPPRCNQTHPSPNPTQSPLLFYGRCYSKIRFFLSLA